MFHSPKRSRFESSGGYGVGVAYMASNQLGELSQRKATHVEQTETRQTEENPKHDRRRGRVTGSCNRNNEPRTRDARQQARSSDDLLEGDALITQRTPNSQ